MNDYLKSLCKGGDGLCTDEAEADGYCDAHHPMAGLAAHHRGDGCKGGHFAVVSVEDAEDTITTLRSRFATLVAALRAAKQEHRANCSAHPSYLEGACDAWCGADAHNAAIERAIEEAGK